MAQSKKDTIAVIITAYNEADSITDCISSAKNLTHNIIVIDTESTDDTKKLAEKAGAKVYSHKNTKYVEPTRNFALSKAQADWVFILDADERISKKLAEDIQQTISKTHHTHFLVKRRNIFAKKYPLMHGGWTGEEIIRLIKKDAFRSWPKEIHSTPEIKGSQGLLNEYLDHFFHQNLEDMVEKTRVYEEIEAELHYKAGHSADTQTFFRKFFGELNRRMFKWKGYKDGVPGIIESLYQAFSKTFTYILLYEKNTKNSSR